MLLVHVSTYPPVDSQLFMPAWLWCNTINSWSHCLQERPRQFYWDRVQHAMLITAQSRTPSLLHLLLHTSLIVDRTVSAHTILTPWYSRFHHKKLIDILNIHKYWHVLLIKSNFLVPESYVTSSYPSHLTIQ